MIPYFEPPRLDLPLGLKLDAFGIVAAFGTLLGAHLAMRAARKYGPGDDEPLREVTTWAVVGGLIGGHLLHVFGYHPELIQQQGWLVVLKVWDGLSSMGGVLGALAGIALYFQRRGLSLKPYLDALALGTAPGWAVARVGCFLVHDHPGVRTDFFLAVDFPASSYFGGPRHDLGLYDAIVLGALTAVLYALARRRPPQGVLMGVLAVGYSVQRFFMDFLRASDLSFVDKRWLGLTPAQYIVVGLFAVGLWLIASARKVALAR